tara:strand:- start:55 stop:489 length:435 start_codon:yes stop_codon:yes gene_type:complete
MSAFEYAWAVLKQDDSYERAQAMQRRVSEHQPDIGRQIYPEGNLSPYHSAIIGLMRRKDMQDTFNEGQSREELGDDFHERSDFEHELSGHPIDDAAERARMNFDEMTGRITRKSMGHARAPSDVYVDVPKSQHDAAYRTRYGSQ